MKTLIFLFSFFIFYTSNAQSTIELVEREDSKYFKKLEIFEGCFLTLTAFDTTNSYNSNHPRVIVNLFKVTGNSLDTVIADTLFAKNSITAEPELNFEFIDFKYGPIYSDFNFDGIQDVALQAGTDPRGNYGLHLYIVNKENKTLEYVDGFKKIGNPRPDGPTIFLRLFIP